MINDPSLPLHFREAEFLDRFRGMGMKIEPCQATFLLSHNIKYTPDFFLPDLNTYVEVIGSRQAFHQNRKKYAELLVSGAVNFMLVTHDFQPLFPEKHMSLRIIRCAVTNCLRRGSIKEYAGKRLCPRHVEQFHALGFVEDSDGQWKRDVKAVGRGMCGFVDCRREVSSKGLCSAHYRQRQKGEPLSPIKRGRPAKAKPLKYPLDVLSLTSGSVGGTNE